jgi:hypothetical protein
LEIVSEPDMRSGEEAGHIWKNCVPSCSISAYPTAVWKKAVCAVMPIFPFVLSARRIGDEDGNQEHQFLQRCPEGD